MLGPHEKEEGFPTHPHTISCVPLSATHPRTISCVPLSGGPRNVYPLAFLQKWWFHVAILFLCVRMGHRDMKTPKRGQDLTRVGSMGSEVVVLRYESRIFMHDSHVCDASVTSKSYIIFSSLHHSYIPILGPHAKGEGSPTLVRFRVSHCLAGPATYTP